MGTSTNSNLSQNFCTITDTKSVFLEKINLSVKIFTKHTLDVKINDLIACILNPFFGNNN